MPQHTPSTDNRVSMKIRLILEAKSEMKRWQWILSRYKFEKGWEKEVQQAGRQRLEEKPVEPASALGTTLLYQDLVSHMWYMQLRIYYWRVAEVGRALPMDVLKISPPALFASYIWLRRTLLPVRESLDVSFKQLEWQIKLPLIQKNFQQWKTMKNTVTHPAFLD
jgi:hypothetical protein